MESQGIDTDAAAGDQGPVLIGGAAASEERADSVGTGGWGSDAADAVRLLEELSGR